MTDIIKLIEDFKNGDESAFNQIYKQYNGLTRSIIYSYTKDRETINDHNQEVWSIIYTKIHLYQSNNFSGWIKRLTVNKCIDIYRLKKLNTESINDYTLYDDEVPNEIEEKNNFENILSEIYENLTTLTDNQLKVLVLRLKGISFKDIVKKLNIPYGTCTNLYQAAVIKIRREMIKMGYEIDLPTNLHRE
jgi:RNA polymerase sigma-70 factor (ECF subfamily)